MFNYKLNYVVLLVSLFIQLSGCKKNNDEVQILCNDVAKPPDTYIYPIKPGTPKWDTLASGDERLNACQLPDSILSSISTEGLIQSWLDFPLANEILTANSLQEGIEFFIENFSGLEELSKRKDAGEKLYERYKKMNPLCIARLTNDIDRGDYTFSFTYIEMLLGQDTILNKLTTLQKKLLVSEALNKNNNKNSYSFYFGAFGTATCMFVCGRVMQNALYQPFLTEIHNSFILEQFLNTCLLPPDENLGSELFTSILNHSSNFIK